MNDIEQKIKDKKDQIRKLIGEIGKLATTNHLDVYFLDLKEAMSDTQMDIMDDLYGKGNWSYSSIECS